jgi:hypothetical protein
VRVTPIRFVLPVLTVLLLALQFNFPTAPFASAHSADASSTESLERHTGAGAEEAEREYVTCGPPGYDGDGSRLLHTRDRHRAAAGTAPEALSRSLVTGDTEGTYPPAELARRTSRSSTAHSPAALQVFRC